ncbi:MAG: restriction endonuclease [Sodaliphilus pleomorphus]|uniref:Eco57I restriction-modification methylase domain-containing protein n=1 Tax=Sodaliphilus pleomorphus TaxID=2606626 RepID=UPI002A74E82E|nr:restriction endonuclease [Sodaliphilus pleomorphus]MDY2831427.1 restriction endonuclease [Sodaliphilus pleomorphus]
MEYTSIHIYGHLLSDDILHSVEQDGNFVGNTQQDYGIDAAVDQSIDYVWSSLRNDWNFYKERSLANDPYGTRRARDLISRLLSSLGYELKQNSTNTVIEGQSFDITYFADNIASLPIIVVGDLTGDSDIDTLDRCSLDYRAKGAQRRRSPHATMLEYLNSTECVYGIVANGQTLRIIRNSGQLVKLTYIEFDLRRMLDEDKYSEFRLMFRLLHASRYRTTGDEPCVMERWFNMSIESGNRIRAGLSEAVQHAMERIGNAAFTGEQNEALRQAFSDGDITADMFNKELIHFIYRLLFLFIIEDRGLVYQIPGPDHPDYDRICRHQDVYSKFYAASRLRGLSEVAYLRTSDYADLWQGLMDTFRLFEDESFGSTLSIKPLGGVLFGGDTLHWLKQCTISNKDVLAAFAALNQFNDERGQVVKINYSALDVEEFGSVYEGILEMRPFVQQAQAPANWAFGFVGGLDRKSTSSYYTRPDLVQNLIRTTLEPVIKERIAKLKTPEEKVQSLLSMKVCDAASGSGHIVLAMARTIAWYVSTIRTGEDNPASLDYREALREVIARCVYAVDYNPDAVELCKVVLWIEGYCAGRPLSFLDHHIRCGNSVVGITDLNTLLDGVPKEAFSADNKDALKKIRDLNKKALDDAALIRDAHGIGIQATLFNGEFVMRDITEEQVGLAQHVKEISELPETTLLETITKQKRWEDLMVSPRVECLRRACDIYTYAFYKQFSEEELTDDGTGKADFSTLPYTRTVYQALEEIRELENPTTDYKPLSSAFKKEVADVASRQSFFHWCVEFPEVFAYDGGFDVMCGNPPWDKLQMEDEKWFVGKDNDVVNAANQSARNKKIAALETSNPALFDEYQRAKADIASQSSFIKNSGRFELCNRGKIELSSLFAEIYLNFSKESWGIVCPTSIAFSDSTKFFFEKLVAENRLVSLFDFENRDKLFAIDSRYKFCLLTASRSSQKSRTVSGGFYLTRIDHLLDPNRIYKLQTDDFIRLNPNTKTCPIFRTSKDAEITRSLYQRAPILYNEETGENPWGIKLSTLFNMATHSYLFRTQEQLKELGAARDGNNFTLNGETFVPLYEGKLFWHYNHHYGSFPDSGQRPSSIPTTELSELKDPSSNLRAWYWIALSNVEDRLVDKDKNDNVRWEWTHSYFITFRDVTNATNERTCVASLMPSACGAGHKAPLVFTSRSLIPSCSLLAILSSLTFDYIARQKVGGSSMAFFMLKQLPVLAPEQIPEAMQWEIAKRVAQLCYFNHDLDGWAEEMWDEMNEAQRAELPQLGCKQPFIYDPDRRAVLQAELDAIIAHLYGLTTDELRYILDPEDICGPGCINETFRVLKDNETRQYGEYRTKRLVLAAWHKFHYHN